MTPEEALEKVSKKQITKREWEAVIVAYNQGICKRLPRVTNLSKKLGYIL